MSEDTIFREVDEELRRDRLQSGWRRYGPFVIGAAIAVVGIVAVNEGWSWWQNSNSARSSDQFYAALNLDDGGDIAGAQKALDTVHLDVVICEPSDRVRQDIRRSSLVLDAMFLGEIDNEPLQP